MLPVAEVWPVGPVHPRPERLFHVCGCYEEREAEPWRAAASLRVPGSPSPAHGLPAGALPPQGPRAVLCPGAFGGDTWASRDRPPYTEYPAAPAPLTATNEMAKWGGAGTGRLSLGPSTGVSGQPWPDGGVRRDLAGGGRAGWLSRAAAVRVPAPGLLCPVLGGKAASSTSFSFRRFQATQTA